MTSSLHADQIVFDGLIVANWAPDIFHDMRRGGLTAANCTCCIWEGFTSIFAINSVARCKRQAARARAGCDDHYACRFQPR